MNRRQLQLLIANCLSIFIGLAVEHLFELWTLSLDWADALVDAGAAAAIVLVYSSFLSRPLIRPAVGPPHPRRFFYALGMRLVGVYLLLAVRDGAGDYLKYHSLTAREIYGIATLHMSPAGLFTCVVFFAFSSFWFAYGPPASQNQNSEIKNPS